MVSSQPEPEFDDIEREWFMALVEHRAKVKADTCELCGLPKSVCRKSANERRFDAEYERCFARAAIVRLRDEVGKGEGADQMLEAASWSARLRD